MSEFFSRLTWVDYLTAIVFLWGAYAGYKAGFFAEILNVVGYVITAIVTLYFKDSLAQYLTLKTFLNTTTASAVAVFALLIVVFAVTRVAAMLILKVLKPGEGALGSRLIGLVIGAARWVVMLGLVFMLIDTLPLAPLQTDIHQRSLVGPKVARIAPLIFDFAVTAVPGFKEVKK